MDEKREGDEADAARPSGQREDRRTTVPGQVMPDGPTREEDRPVIDLIEDETGDAPREPGDTPRRDEGWIADEPTDEKKKGA